jgi:hypothetical protein
MWIEKPRPEVLPALQVFKVELKFAAIVSRKRSGSSQSSAVYVHFDLGPIRTAFQQL